MLQWAAVGRNAPDAPGAATAEANRRCHNRTMQTTRIAFPADAMPRPAPKRAGASARLRAALPFACIAIAYAAVATWNIALPGIYMDEVNPDYLVVKVLNRHHEPVIAWLLQGNYLFNDRYPLLIQLYHGSQPFWFGLPLYWLFGTGVEGIRLVHAVFGLCVLGALFALLRALGTRAWIAVATCAAMAIDPSFSYAFRTQSTITLFACTWMLLALALLRWNGHRGEAPWRALWSGIFCAWAGVGYFVAGFFAPAVAVAAWVLARTEPRGAAGYRARWIAGFVLGLAPAIAGYGLLVDDAGGMAQAVDYVRTQQSQLKPFSSTLGLVERLSYAWTMIVAVVSNAWHHSMMFQEWVEVPLTPIKLLLLAALPAALWIAAELQRRATFAHRTLVALPLCFVALALVFGNRLAGHHYVVLVPCLYAALGYGLERSVSGLARGAGVAAVAVLAALGVVNVLGQSAEARRLQETHGVGFMSDAINRFATDLSHAAHKPFVYFPDWGLAMPVALITRGTVGMDSVENFAQARELLCAGRDVGVALIEGDRAARAQRWQARIGWSPPEVTHYRQHDGTPLFDYVMFRSDPASPACGPESRHAGSP